MWALPSVWSRDVTKTYVLSLAQVTHSQFGQQKHIQRQTTRSHYFNMRKDQTQLKIQRQIFLCSSPPGHRHGCRVWQPALRYLRRRLGLLQGLCRCVWSTDPGAAPPPAPDPASGVPRYLPGCRAHQWYGCLQDQWKHWLRCSGSLHQDQGWQIHWRSLLHHLILYLLLPFSAGFGLSPGITREQRLQVESLMKKAFSKLIGDLAGTYYPLTGGTRSWRIWIRNFRSHVQAPQEWMRKSGSSL